MTKSLRHLALNAVFLEPQMGGMVTYVLKLVEAILTLRPDLTLTVFCSEGGRDTFTSAPWSGQLNVVTHPLLGRRYFTALSELVLLGRLVRESNAELLHSLAMTGPLRTEVPHVVTVPDLIWRRFPSSGRVTVIVWRTIVPPVARRADRIVTFSEASLRDIVALLGVDAARVDVIPLGAAERSLDSMTADEARRRFDLGAGPVVLSVSSKKPHKNLVRLVEAMGNVASRHPDATLVIPGSPAPHDDELRREAARSGARLRLPGWIGEGELEGLYAAATCVAFPSLQEGFGLPVLEAMRREVPVACSNASSLPEVGGADASYFDPMQVDDITRAILELLGDEDRARDLARAGRQRAAQFTWEAVAERHLETYARALDARPR